jgi:hypothetical protein
MGQRKKQVMTPPKAISGNPFSITCKMVGYTGLGRNP